MKLLICAVFDEKVGAFTPPQTFRSKGEALRSWMDAVGNENSPFCKHPTDYAFFKLGELDDATGAITGEVRPLMTAVECRAAVSKE